METVRAEIVSTSKLRQNNGQIQGLPKNPRTIKDARFKALVQSIADAPEMLELREVIAYDNDGELVVIMGNMRLRACISLGIDAVPCKILPKSTPVEKLKEYAVKDNIAFGDNDIEAFSLDWDVEELEKWGFDEIDELKQLSVNICQDITEDEFENKQIEAPARCNFGDIWQLGNHRLVCGDSTKSETFDILMKDDRASMVFTDPPYDLDDTSFFNHILNHTADDCHIFCMSSDKHLVKIASEHIDIFKKFFSVDFRLAHLISNNQPMTRVDLVAEFGKGKNRFINCKDAFTTLIECAKIHSNNTKNNYGHKQAKKIELPAKFVEHYSVQGDIVLDAFGGSGTTIMACEQLGRCCRSIEFEPRYCDIILMRWEMLTGKTATKLNV